MVDPRSAALLWRPLAAFVEVEARLSAWAAQRPLTAALYEFVRFGVKQAWACLFAAIMLALLIGSHAFYPKAAPLARYDFLVLAALTVQAGMLIARLETFEEAKVIFVFHLVGTAMEVFKTATGSWVYPEPSLIRIGGVPLFTGFCTPRSGRSSPATGGCFISASRAIPRFGQSICWRWRSMRISSSIIGASICVGCWSRRRWRFFAPTVIHYRVWRVDRRMPLLLANFLTAGFLWAAENIGTLTNAWLYPAQAQGWRFVGFSKFSSWFLLLFVSYALVAAVNRPEKP